MARRGICSSPLSSADETEEDAGAASTFPEMSQSPPASKPAKSRAAGSKRKASRAKKALLPPTKKPKPSAAVERKSTKELVHDAPQEFIEYLAEQLSAVQQAKFEAEFGGGQGYIVKLPAASWKTKRKRDELQLWIQALGFSSGASLGRSALRVASLKADVILSELKQRVPSIAEGGENEKEIGVEGEDGGEAASGDDEDEKEQAGDYSTDPAMIRLKKYFQKLESQTLEVVSYSENHRLLSSTQHMAIADAMEDVLAQPSVRRDRRLARRLSKLGRISGRRLSSIAMAPSSSSFLPPVEDDWKWDREMSKMSLTPVKRHISLGDSSSPKKTIMLEENVLYLVLHSGLIDVTTMKEVLRKVSTVWEKIAIMSYAWAIADYSKKANFYSMHQVYNRHPRGHYLANGAYKEVFKVFSSEKKRLEAVSVMNISAIENTGNQGVIRQEVAHSVLLSDATAHGICPNFLRIYDVFLAKEQPRQERWGSQTHRKPVELLADASSYSATSNNQDNSSPSPSMRSDSLFQYIRMEFCDGGDLEDFIGLQKGKILPLESVAVPFFFQMVFGLFCARERFKLRHGDVKLLNFFLRDIGRANLSKGPGADVVLHYLLEDSCFVLKMPASFSYWVKLADYGAADSNPENLGKPVTIDQFATLENSPIEFLLEGDAAEQSYAADTFSLGLCLLHLFTGSAPYEEILEDVQCPAELLKDLKFIWMSPRKNSEFSVIKTKPKRKQRD
ncbi:serine/threonine protein kinase [Phytophthora cinnamomi]|uniref:serine/threonine protein kinase n=1 Tax=Phytophthora cinnamomi TaxID=4785 RepID=UPI00355A47EE|nr:serine/threonine protein kinase [Phytophthora cinnamomi]